MFNVVHGLGGDCGGPLVSHSDVSAVSFTGGTSTGATVAALAAPQFKKLSLELGGKSPNIIFDDANIDAACAGAVSGIFAATGQTCIAGSRLLVQNTIREEVEAKLIEMTGVYATIANQGKLARPHGIRGIRLRGDPVPIDRGVEVPGPEVISEETAGLLTHMMQVVVREGTGCLLYTSPSPRDRG